MAAWYHASTAAIETLDRDVCLADSRDAAIGYLEGKSGTLYSVDVGAMVIAREAELRDAADALGIDHGPSSDYPRAYDLADSAKVRRALVASGYTAIQYADLGPDNAYGHDCLRLLDGHGAVIIASEPV